MEELQDAIEDAQYVNAISTQEDGPRPVIPWELPDEEQLAKWEEEEKKRILDNPKYKYDAFEFDWALSSPIGLFLFSSFVKTCKDDYVRMNFIEDICRFRKFRGGNEKYSAATKIFKTYLRTPEYEKETGELIKPKRVEIDEYDLERIAPSLGITKEELEILYSLNLEKKKVVVTNDTENATTTEGNGGNQPEGQGDAASKKEDAEEKMNVENSESTNEEVGEKPKCHVGVNGPILGEIFQEMRACERRHLKSTERSESLSTIQGNPSRRNKETKELEDGTKGTTEEGTAATSATTTPENEMLSNNGAETKKSVSDSALIVKQTLDLDPHTTSLRKLTLRFKSPTNSTIPTNLFDKIDILVVESLRRDYWDDFRQSEQYKKIKNFLWYEDRAVEPDDFFVMRVLGRGGFGLVTACKKGTSGKLYAMKVMNKRRIKMKKSEQLAVNEMMALAAVESKFVCNLKYSFHSKEDIYLILDLMTGGDLGFHLHTKGRFPKKECLYYAARIMLGLQALHDQQYVYRDLKPENCLLADDGRVKLTDLGLATKITSSLHGAAGTRGYWAPEMLRRDKKGKRMPYGHTVDWFSFGCCVAEFISGQNPFRSEEALNFGLERGKQTKEKAIDCATLEMDPKFDPEKFEPDAADLCRRLLDKNEKTRLGTNGCEEIMAHPWFKNINWEQIISDRKRPPYIPPKDVNAASQSEIGNFAEDKALQETVVEEKDQKIYKNWAWTNKRAFAAEVIEFLIYERETGEPLLPVAQHASCCCTIL